MLSRSWKQHEYPTSEAWMQKMWFNYTMYYYSAIKNEDILSFAGKWMKLESNILSKVTQTQKYMHGMHSLISAYYPPKVQNTQVPVHRMQKVQQPEGSKWGCLSHTWKEEAGSHKLGGKGGKDLGGKVDGSQGRGAWYGIGWGKRTEALRAIRHNVNRPPWEVGGWGGILQCTAETMEVRDSQNSKGETLDEIPPSKERDLTEPVSNRKAGHQMREGVASHSQNTNP